MKRIALIILLFACPILAQSEILTNADIISMSQAGLGKSVIIQKIKSTVGEYDASSKALIELKKAQVEDDVIKLIIEKSKIVKEKSLKDSVQSQALEEREKYTPQKKVFTPLFWRGVR